MNLVPAFLIASLAASPFVPRELLHAAPEAAKKPSESKAVAEVPRAAAIGADTAAAAPSTGSGPMGPEVAKAVDAMQKYYEKLKDFDATFTQVYLYKTFKRRQTSSGRVRFMPATMRWDYEKPSPKVFVVAGSKVYMYDPDAKTLTIAGINAQKLSASITFLWGQGKLEREFDITRANRKDLKDGIALELTPKVPDPRFLRVFMLVDPKTYQAKTTVVVDPDGSENHMTFTDVKLNSGFGPEVFKLTPKTSWPFA